MGQDEHGIEIEEDDRIIDNTFIELINGHPVLIELIGSWEGSEKG